MRKFKGGDILKCVGIPNWWDGYEGHKIGDLAVFVKYRHDSDSDWFNIRWKNEKATEYNRFLDEMKITNGSDVDIVCWEFAYDENTKQRQNEYLIRNL
jgi:hypothetical protein